MYDDSLKPCKLLSWLSTAYIKVSHILRAQFEGGGGGDQHGLPHVAKQHCSASTSAFNLKLRNIIPDNKHPHPQTNPINNHQTWPASKIKHRSHIPASMESASASLCSSMLPLNRPAARTRRLAGLVAASARRSGGHDEQHWGSGRMVDENLIVLRKRIHETKMIEKNYEPPAEWMEWEKKLYTSYDSMVCEAVGMLQARLMESRPSRVLAMALLISLSVPASFTLLLLRVLDSL
uniref:Uncharacterized protein n=1 Tax=Kalanchoe fedtschenkoi TaxID=63787 RepID=A0A7N0VAY5_KALFE